MTSSLHRAETNKGVLGQVCNALMLAKALYGGLPQRPPAPLETVIDASVKSGADLSRVRQWCFDASRMILEAGKPIPFILQDRLSIDYEEGKRPPRPRGSRDHWIDMLLAGVEAHIAWVEMMRDELMSRTMPPLALFQAAFQQPDTLDIGAQLTQRYTAKLPWTKRHKRSRRALGLEVARAESESFLADYLADQQRAILRGALAHYYLKGHHSGADEVAWQLGAQTDEGRDAGIAQWTIQALREVGILNEIADIDGQVLSYPAATILPLGIAPLEVRNVWFNWHRVQCQRRGAVAPERLQDVSKVDERQAKAEIADLLHTHMRGMQLMVQACEDRLVLMTPQGNLFGYVAREDSDRLQVGQSLQIRFALQRRGHLLVMPN